MIELDVDMVYLDDDDLNHVVLHDECGEHESVEYVRRDEYDEMREATARRKDRCLEPLEENAKLRELVLCLLSCSSDTGDACDKCPVNGGAGIWDFEDFCDSLLDRVHELRIEVDE